MPPGITTSVNSGSLGVSLGSTSSATEALFPRTTTTEQVKDAQVLLRAPWRVEPRLERPAPIGDLTDAEREWVCDLMMIPSQPDELEIVRPVAWELELVRRRKAGEFPEASRYARRRAGHGRRPRAGPGEPEGVHHRPVQHNPFRHRY